MIIHVQTAMKQTSSLFTIWNLHLHPLTLPKVLNFFFFWNNLPLVKQWILFLLQMCISLVCFRTLIFKNIYDNCVYLLGMCINLKYAKAESKVTLFARECASSGISGLWDRGLTKGSKAKHVWLLSNNFLVLVLKITWNHS